ncbi:MAG: hydroxymethylglutaryl-CoA reductase [Methanomassiliicoccales archaeon]
MPPSSLPRGNDNGAIKERIDVVERECGLKLRHIVSHSVNPSVISKNIENFIGFTQVPLGVVGPLRVKGQAADGDFYIPLATTEAALLATINRGCSVLTSSGGVRVMIVRDAMTRAPVFRTEGIAHAVKVSEWVAAHLEDMREKVRHISSHASLLSATPFICGRTLYIRFAFRTGDAMGMNMATIASQELCDEIENSTGAKTISVSGNMCTDKKAAAINFIQGRGKTVLAEAVIPEETVERKLHTTSSSVAETAYRKNLLGSAMSLSMGFNSHFANMAAALFIATGQDAAQAVDASLGISTAENTEDGLYFSVTIPSLEIGTIGGGTKLPTQREALEIMGCYGEGKAAKLAEIAGALILAGEISTLGAQSAGELAEAHRRLSR